MEPASIADALQRAERSYQRKPGLARHGDVPAQAAWTGGLATRIDTPDGGTLRTDLHPVLGGGGAGVSPGWLMRAGLAACLTSAVALRAARQGIALRRLEVRADSVSDVRGLLGTAPEVPSGPLEIALHVVIEADGVAPATLHELVAWADAHSPVSDALRRALDLRLQLDVVAG